MTEDAIKSFLSEFQLPKDIVSGIQNNARVAKEDFVEMIRTELSKKFEKINSADFFDELLQKYDVEVWSSSLLNFKYAFVEPCNVNAFINLNAF